MLLYQVGRPSPVALPFERSRWRCLTFHCNGLASLATELDIIGQQAFNVVSRAEAVSMALFNRLITSKSHSGSPPSGGDKNSPVEGYEREVIEVYYWGIIQ
jgi:hypothetical protein